MATTKHRQSRTTSTRTQPTKKRSRNDFGAIMEQATESQPRSRRLFSRLIHMDTVYFISELLAGTLARPNAILLGAVVSFFATLAAYLFAKNFGYSLSGFETIGAFAVGWALGMVFDIFSLLLKKK